MRRQEAAERAEEKQIRDQQDTDVEDARLGDTGQILRIAAGVQTWSYFARVQAEADWLALFPGETP